MIEVEVLLSTTHDCLVSLVEVLLGYHVSILSYCLHTRLLADARNIRSAYLVRSTHVLLQVHIFRKVHLGSDSLEDKSLLPAIRQREFDLTIETTRSEKSRIECICTIGRHDDLHIDVLLKAVHLVEQLNQHSLHFSISSSLRIETPI